MYRAKSMHQFRLSQMLRYACVLFILFEQSGICQTNEPAYKKYGTQAEPFNHPVAKLIKEWNNLTTTREFTDATKQFKVKAQVIDFTEESVTIRILGESDTTIVPLAKLDPSHAKEITRLIALDKQIPNELAKYKEIHTDLKNNSVSRSETTIAVKDIIQLNDIPKRITPEHFGKMVIIEVLYNDRTGNADAIGRYPLLRMDFSLEQSSPVKIENGKLTEWRVFAETKYGTQYYDTFDDRKVGKPTNIYGRYTRRLLLSRTHDVATTNTFLETRGDDVPDLREALDLETIQNAGYELIDGKLVLNDPEFRNHYFKDLYAFSDRTDAFVHNGLAYELSIPKELFFNGRKNLDYGLKFLYNLALRADARDDNFRFKSYSERLAGAFRGFGLGSPEPDKLEYEWSGESAFGDGGPNYPMPPMRVFFHAYVGTPVKQRFVLANGGRGKRSGRQELVNDDVSLINYDRQHFETQFETRRRALGAGLPVSSVKIHPQLSVGVNDFILTPPASSLTSINNQLLERDKNTPEGTDIFKTYEAIRDLCSKVGTYTIKASKTDEEVEVIRLYIQKWSIPSAEHPTNGRWNIRDDKTVTLRPK